MGVATPDYFDTSLREKNSWFFMNNITVKAIMFVRMLNSFLLFYAFKLNSVVFLINSASVGLYGPVICRYMAKR